MQNCKMEVRRASRWYSFPKMGSARPICLPPDMKSSVPTMRSHRGGIGSARLKGLIEAADQHAYRCVSHCFIPMIERAVERQLVPHDGDHGAEDGGHPQQCGKAPAEADAAEHRENDQDREPHA